MSIYIACFPFNDKSRHKHHSIFFGIQ